MDSVFGFFAGATVTRIVYQVSMNRKAVRGVSKTVAVTTCGYKVSISLSLLLLLLLHDDDNGTDEDDDN